MLYRPTNDLFVNRVTSADFEMDCVSTVTTTRGDVDPGSVAAAVGGQPSAAGKATCYGCGRPIKDRWLLRAVDRFWHENCLRCSYCQCALAAVGSTLFARADLLLCRRDYVRSAPHVYLSQSGGSQLVSNSTR